MEELAERLNLEIENPEKVKDVNASIANGKKVLVYSGIDFDSSFIRGAEIKFEDIKKLRQVKNFDSAIAITNKIVSLPVKKSVLFLRPKNLVIGIGSRRNIEKEAVLSAIRNAMGKARLAGKSIRAIAIPEFRRNERGIVKAASVLRAELIIISKNKIKEKEHLFTSSSFVKSRIGIGSVSEPCAVLACKNSKLLRKKVKYKGVTVAIGELK